MAKITKMLLHSVFQVKSVKKMWLNNSAACKDQIIAFDNKWLEVVNEKINNGY
jgi:hypothetical protein